MSEPFLRAAEVRAIDEVVRENEDQHFHQVVREVERLVRASASMEPEDAYVVYDVPRFSASLTSFTMRYGDLVARLVRHFRRQGFGAYAVPRGAPGAAPSAWLYVSWRAARGRPPSEDGFFWRGGR